MSLIFHAFELRSEAVRFADYVNDTYDLNAKVFDTQEASNEVDPFPYILIPPIVLVDRYVRRVENIICGQVHHYNGEFIGT